MISDFLLPWGRLAATALSAEERTTLGIPEYASQRLEFGQQNGSGYWSHANVIDHTVNCALKIFQAVCPGYRALYLYDNASSHSSYATEALRVQSMNLGAGGDQPLLRDGYYLKEGRKILQSMVGEDGIPKGIETILQERGLWKEGLWLECTKPYCNQCLLRKRCRNCVKGSYCTSHTPQRGKKPYCYQCLLRKKCSKCMKGSYCTSHKPQRGKKRECRGKEYCSPRQQCDICMARKGCQRCKKKQYCHDCQPFLGRKCQACEALPPACLSLGEFTLIVNISSLTQSMNTLRLRLY